MKQTESPAIRAIQEIKKAVIGKDDCIIKVMTAILAGGHILIEDVPGVGKTTLALAFSKALHLEQNRIQFTPDVLPGDVTGFSLYQKATGTFEYQPGAVMCNLLLADEINRTSPKTQAALLEVMEEGKVTVDQITHELPKPFVVIATQNPVGSAGTSMLPQSQLDRFMICVSMGYPEHQDAVAILKGESADLLSKVQPVLSAEELCALRSTSETIFVHDSIYDYIVNLVEETRHNDLFEMGASPRATIALLRISRAMAMIAGRDFVTAADVQKVLRDVLGHRVRLSARTRAERITVDQAMEQLVQTVKAPRM